MMVIVISYLYFRSIVLIACMHIHYFLKTILSPSLCQVYETLLLMLFYFLYTYARPYKATIVNIIETALLAYLGLFLIMSRIQEHQDVYNIQLDEPSLDSCGNEMPSICPAWIVLGVFYFLPLTVLLFFLGRWLLCSRVVRLLRYEANSQRVGV